jgi:hypothetical protein
MGQRTVELLDCKAHRAFASSLHQIIYSLCFGQIDSTVEECPAGKFTSLGHPRSSSHRHAADTLQEVSAAMALQFRNIFSGKTVWLTKDHRHRAVDARMGLGIEDIA